MDSNSENEDVCNVKLLNPELTDKSKKKYESVFKLFMDWRMKNQIYSYSENVLLTYFAELSKKYKSSSLWAFYSMLKSTLSINEGINIENYQELHSFLKQKSEGFKSKRAKTFTSEEINKFIQEAPDDKFLATKVGLIMCVLGNCRRSEMYEMKTKHLEDLGVAFLVTVPSSTTKTVRKFAITDDFYKICKKYVELRPSNFITDDFFYQKNHKIGINKFSSMWKQIASFLSLPNPDEYSVRSFQLSTPKSLKSHMDIMSTSMTQDCTQESFKSSTSTTGDYCDTQMETGKVDDDYTDGLIKTEIDDGDCVEDFLECETESENEMFDTVPQNPTNTNSNSKNSMSWNNEKFRFDINSVPIIQFTNCSNINIYFENKKVS